jgi:L-malate glycosyltransferase
MDKSLNILHAHSGFNLGGKEARAVRLMNIWGDRARHTILSAQSDALGAAKAIDPTVSVTFPDDAPSLQGLPGFRRYLALARYMRQFDLVLTYNWGSMDVVMAHRMFSPFMRLPNLIHHEDGFNEDEAGGLKPKRNIFRRFALARAFAVVVPSTLLHSIARSVWHQPEARIRQIPNGVEVARYAARPEDSAIPGFIRSPGKLVVGTLAGLRRVKNVPRLVRAVAPLKDSLQLVVVGEGPEKEAIAAEAKALGLSDICLPGFMAEPWHFIGVFDIFALSSDSEQFPISLVEAMSAGLPVVSTDVGDVRAMVAAENGAFVVDVNDEAAMTGALGKLSVDAELRKRVGAANQAQAVQHFDEAAMVESYAKLYGDAAGQQSKLL